MSRIGQSRFSLPLCRADPENFAAARKVGAGIDNRVAIWSDRYRDQPLVIQGPGTGAEVTAAGLLDDVLAIAADQARAASVAW